MPGDGGRQLSRMHDLAAFPMWLSLILSRDPLVSLEPRHYFYALLFPI